MVPRAPTPSSRLVRAAAAEREGLQRHRAQLIARRDDLRAELEGIDAVLREIDERDALLHRLARPATTAFALDAPEEPATVVSVAPARTLAPAATPLRGPDIRAAAVRVLLEHPERPDALHYREWFAALKDAGYAVAGKEPLAVFLTQLSRSPVVRKGTQSGVYELDRDAPRRLRGRLDALHDQLRNLTSAPGAMADLATVRARRAEVTAEITRTEKALEEAAALLMPRASTAAG
ncbi:MAG: hypothetical protein QOH46_3564 [Solirubrobacteraceae bacterium]|nr:hypothetical protein [Solirubrobacteraceae bacterium]